MTYNPRSTDRAHHLAALTAATSWHAVADIWRNVLRIPPEMADFSLGRFIVMAGERTRLTVDDLMRRLATLQRVELYADGAPVEKFLSDDLDAVEAATRIAWHDMNRGRQMLLDIRSGELPKSAAAAFLETLERRTSRPVAPTAKKSPHDNWSHYDVHLEMLEFDRLHTILSRGDEVRAADYDRLTRLARSAGYADADSFVAAHGSDPSEDDARAAAEREQFEGYMDGDYWNQIDRSQKTLQDIGTDEARRTAMAVCDAMRDAYEKGRAARLDRSTEPSPAP